ncbi:TPA: hypothetical protein OZU02_004887, partial [Escherichia coli]|nr:hypothetical protein [Escherichia coli]HCX5186028.1 hypothetical protein [Escherichia coli]
SKSCSSIGVICFFLIIPNSVKSAEFNALGKPTKDNIQNEQSTYSNSVLSGRYTFGMRKNAVVSSFVANNSSPLNIPVLGLGSVSGLAHYLDRDSVALYAENNSSPFRKWEKIKSPQITPTSVLSEDISPTDIKVGMIIETETQPKWSTYVVSVVPGKIITAGWVNLKTKRMGTPDNHSSLVVNPVTKIWSANFNLIFPEGGRATKGVVQENGIINNSATSKNVNGVDTVVLPQSKFDGNIAYLARSTSLGNAKKWDYGFVSIGNRVSFSSRDNQINSPDISFNDESKSKIGLLFSGKNTAHSIVWKNGDTIVASVSPRGEIEKLNFKTKIINSSQALDSNFGRYIFKINSNIDVTLPDEKDLTDGYTLKLTSINDDGFIVSVKSINNKKLNGVESLKLKHGRWNLEAVYFQNEWIIE